MTKIRKLLQLLLTTSLSHRQIASAAGVSRTTVIRYRTIVAERRYDWDTLQALSDDVLDTRFNKATHRLARRRLPDFALIHQQMRQPEVTLLLLWEEYRLPEPDNALSYSQFTELYRRYRKQIDRTMRQSHVPGEKCFVDFSGRKPGYTNPVTGEWVAVELFVGVLGASNLTFAACVERQGLPHWIAVHVDMFRYFGGAARMLVPDNLKAAVSVAGRDFVPNPTYQEMAEHYGTVVVPTRTYRPRDRAKVEGAVLIVQRWILARLRHRQFFSLYELNRAVAQLVEELNRRPFKRLPGCRWSRFEEIERSKMLKLPVGPYEFAEWTGELRVDNGYHVRIHNHWYSVPHHLVGQRVRARATHATVEVFHQHLRIASHERNDEPDGLSTKPEHQPEAHRAYAQRTPEHQLQWARQAGAAILAVVNAQFDRAAPALGLPACDTLRKLVDRHGVDEVELAAQRAVEIGSLTVKSVKSLLATQRHRRRRDPLPDTITPAHSNIRGGQYYAETVEGAPC